MEPGSDAIRSITHDMRNLLTAVRGHAELALRGLPAEEPAREDVAHCVIVTAAIFDLIDQLDGSDTSSTLVAVNLDRTVGAMRRLLDALLPGSFEMHLAPDSDDAHVAISKLRIERIVFNLVLNARDAMEDGGLLSITTATSRKGEAQIIVADSGPGFSEEALEHLFEPGYTSKAERGGSGLGLSALARFVDSAGGSIVVDSVAGEGATVTVTLPMAEFDLPDTDWSEPVEVDEVDEARDTAGDTDGEADAAPDGELEALAGAADTKAADTEAADPEARDSAADTETADTWPA